MQTFQIPTADWTIRELSGANDPAIPAAIWYFSCGFSGDSDVIWFVSHSEKDESLNIVNCREWQEWGLVVMMAIKVR